jgi:hypothetical protein
MTGSWVSPADAGPVTRARATCWRAMCPHRTPGSCLSLNVPQRPTGERCHGPSARWMAWLELAGASATEVAADAKRASRSNRMERAHAWVLLRSSRREMARVLAAAQVSRSSTELARTWGAWGAWSRQTHAQRHCLNRGAGGACVEQLPYGFVMARIGTAPRGGPSRTPPSSGTVAVGPERGHG